LAMLLTMGSQTIMVRSATSRVSNHKVTGAVAMVRAIQDALSPLSRAEY
jgi:hypothetical protein